jgi:hypothetical protein
VGPAGDLPGRDPVRLSSRAGSRGGGRGRDETCARSAGRSERERRGDPGTAGGSGRAGARPYSPASVRDRRLQGAPEGDRSGVRPQASGAALPWATSSATWWVTCRRISTPR